MNLIYLAFILLLGLLLIAGGVAHFRIPALSDPFIPGFLPKDLVHIGVGVTELVLGVGIFIPQLRTQAAWGIFILMLCFLPFHVMDLFREKPAIGSLKLAIIRVPFQFLFIFMAWYVAKTN